MSEGNTWPEQEIIIAWMEKVGVVVSREEQFELQKAVTKRRVDAETIITTQQKKIEELEVLVDGRRRDTRTIETLISQVSAKDHKLTAINDLVEKVKDYFGAECCPYYTGEGDCQTFIGGEICSFCQTKKEIEDFEKRGESSE